MSHRAYVLLLCTSVLVAIACASITGVTEVVATPIVSATPPSQPSDGAPISTAQLELTSLPCSAVGEKVGQSLTCRILNAYCDYRPNQRGKPTFCYDAPFPHHNFTLLVWGSDWSDLDGKCVDVTGMVDRNRGKPEITAESRSQVSVCP